MNRCKIILTGSAMLLARANCKIAKVWLCKFLFSLQPHVQENVRLAWATRTGKIGLPKHLKDIQKIAAFVTTTKRSRPLDNDDNHHDQSSSSKQNRHHSKRHKKQHFSGKNPNNDGHDSSKKPKPKENEDELRSRRFKEGKCIHCGDKYEKGHRCQEYLNYHRKMRETRKLHMIRSKQAEDKMDVDNGSPTVQIQHPADSVLDDINADDGLADATAELTAQSHGKPRLIPRSVCLYTDMFLSILLSS